MKTSGAIFDPETTKIRYNQGMKDQNEKDTRIAKTKKTYKKPTITTQKVEEANATSMGGGGGGTTCNGTGTNAGRKDSSASGCTVLLT